MEGLQSACVKTRTRYAEMRENVEHLMFALEGVTRHLVNTPEHLKRLLVFSTAKTEKS